MAEAISPAACRAARALLKWTLRDLARASGVAFTTIHKLESGAAPRAATAARLVAAFDREGVSILVDRGGCGAVLRPSGSPSSAALQAGAADAIVDFVVRILRTARTSDRQAGLGGAQLSAMSLIRYNPGVSLKALARLEGVTHPTMSRMVSALAAQGWVARRQDPEDARFLRLSLTQAGLDAWDEARSRRVMLMTRLVDRLRPGTVADLVAVLGPLADRIGAPPPAPREAHQDEAAA